jgi:hypothetical protein
MRVTVQDTMFSSLFVINDKVQCHLGILRPFRTGRFFAVTDQISSPVPGESIILVLSDGPRRWGCWCRWCVLFRHGINRVIDVDSIWHHRGIFQMQRLLMCMLCCCVGSERSTHTASDLGFSLVRPPSCSFTPRAPAQARSR